MTSKHNFVHIEQGTGLHVNQCVAMTCNETNFKSRNLKRLSRVDCGGFVFI